MLSEFNAGCNCDCCIVYKSEFCDGHYESAYQRDNPFGVNPNIPSSYPLNGGGLDSFGQVGVFTEWTPLTTPQRIWNTTNTACGFDDSYCGTATDAKGFTYSPDVYLNPTTNLLTSHLLTKVIADKFQWYLRTFWNAESDSANQQTMRFFFDYVDDENWLALDIKYDPDFNVSPGQAQRLFLIQAKKNSSGTVTNLTDEMTYDDGLGDAKADNVDIELNIDQRDDCGTEYFLAGKFKDSEFGFSFTSINGDYIGLQQVATSNVISSEYCLFQDWTYSDSFGVYSWVHQYLDSEKTGCADYSMNCCACYTPSELDVTFSSWDDSECDACDDNLNGTYTLTFRGQVSAPQGYDPDRVCCLWQYDFDPYNLPECSVTALIGGSPNEDTIKFRSISLFLCPEGKWLVSLNVDANFMINGFPSGFRQCNYRWDYDESISEQSQCTLDGETFTIDNNYGCFVTSDGSGNPIIAEFSHWCDTSGTVTVENG